MEKLLEGQNIIVTGTAKGMGKKMVEVFAANGANVFAHARTETEEHKTFCESISKENSVQIFPLYFDLRDTEALKEAIKTIRGTKLPIDGLVNNAGITYNSLFQMTDMGELRNQMEKEAFNNVLYRLMLEEIAKLEKVEVTDEEADMEASKLAEKYQMSKEDFISQFGGIELVKYDLEVRKTIDLLKDLNK